jgi:hypothetical protein
LGIAAWRKIALPITATLLPRQIWQHAGAIRAGTIAARPRGVRLRLRRGQVGLSRRSLVGWRLSQVARYVGSSRCAVGSSCIIGRLACRRLSLVRQATSGAILRALSVALASIPSTIGHAGQHQALPASITLLASGIAGCFRLLTSPGEFLELIAALP